MDRKIGNTFNYDGVKFKVVEDINTLPCKGCYLYDDFYNACLEDETALDELGFCSDYSRKDGKNVLFKKVK